MRSIRESVTFSSLLHLLLPGLGHVFWREYAFGLFVFLVMLIAAVLFFVSFLVTIPVLVKVLLLGLPLVFFFFTFFDLAKSIRTRRTKLTHRTVTALVFLLIAVSYQVFSPSAPVNFLIRNFPEVYVLKDNRLAPVYREGELMATNRLVYSADLFFIDFPVYHALPEHFDIVRFDAADRRSLTGVVIGLPGEYVEVINGMLVVDDYPKYSQAAASQLIAGEWPLTSVEDNSILIATINLGKIDTVYQVPLPAIVGKVDRLF